MKIGWINGIKTTYNSLPSAIFAELKAKLRYAPRKSKNERLQAKRYVQHIKKNIKHY
jgi:hypothetical protein